MDSQYVVEVEVNGFATEGTVAVDGSRLDAKQAKAANKEKLANLKGRGVTLLDSLVRDDGTGILYFEWKPDTEEGADGADTWQAGKQHAALVLSVVAGAGFQRFEHRIVTRGPGDVPGVLAGG